MHSRLDWKDSLAKLLEGNARFRLGLRSVESFASTLRLQEFAEKGQNPSAIILTCSDSRVPTEILFDKGVGDLFVIRVAGNVISRSIIASIEYAAMALKTPLCVVMGHTQCGAVKAAISAARSEANADTPNIGRLLEKLTPAVLDAQRVHSDANLETLWQAAVLMNVRRQVTMIQQQSTALQPMTRQGEFRIIGALYNLHDGEVIFDIDEESKPIINIPLQPVAAKKWNTL